MAFSGDCRVSAALGPSPSNPLRFNIPHSKRPLYLAIQARIFPIKILPPSRNDLPTFFFVVDAKVDFSGFPGSRISDGFIKCSNIIVKNHSLRCHYKKPTGIINGFNFSTSSISQEAESFLLNAINMNLFERLNLAWKIIFPSPTTIKNSNAHIAKQRLKMILFSDRCAVSEEAKQLIVTNIVNTLSDFVVIESEDKVQLSVSTDPALGTIYSVTVPVRRVKPEFQPCDDDVATITNVEYKDTGLSSGSVDVKFDFYVPE